MDWYPYFDDEPGKIERLCLAMDFERATLEFNRHSIV